MPLSGAQRQKRFKTNRQKRDRKIKACIAAMDPNWADDCTMHLVPGRTPGATIAKWDMSRDVAAAMQVLADEHDVKLDDVLRRISEMGLKHAEIRLQSSMWN